MGIWTAFLGLPKSVSILIISLLITLAITVAYKYLTNQKEMKQLKEDIKKLQKDLKENKTDTKKMSAINKEMMEKNMKMMKNSFRPTLYTFIPIIIIFSLLHSTMAYHAIEPGQDFNVSVLMNPGYNEAVSLTIGLYSDTASLNASSSNGSQIQILKKWTIPREHKDKTYIEQTWTLNGDEGEYLLKFNYNDEEHQNKELLISSEHKYKNPPLSELKDSKFKAIEISNKKVHPLGSFSLFGWHPGWLGYYIITSIILSIILRKLMKVY